MSRMERRSGPFVLRKWAQDKPAARAGKSENVKKSFNMMILWQLFISFFKMSPVTFGGGYAMIPLIEREVVNRRKWVKSQDITDMIALAGSIPGAIAINSASLIGYRLAGVLGAIAALLGVIIPTFMIVVALAIFFLSVKGQPKVEAAFIGIGPAVVALITFASLRMARTAVFDKTTFSIAIVTVLTLVFVPIHPVLVILLGAIISVLIVYGRRRLGLVTKFEKKTKVRKRKYKYKDYFIGDGI